jgi:uncharacterized coiled-coil DUF342 family protein
MTEQSENIAQRIEAIKLTFTSVLDDYKKYYVFYHAHPEVDEYQNYYLQSKNQLNNLVKELFEISKNIHIKLDELSDETSDVYNNLKEERITYEKLSTKVNSLTGTKNGSELLIDDFKKRYNQQFYSNIELFFGIILVGIAMKYTFRNE